MTQEVQEVLLIESVASKQQGKPIYFRDMTAIGPRTTADLDLAARFPTQSAAASSPALRHPWTCFEIASVDPKLHGVRRHD